MRVAFALSCVLLVPAVALAGPLTKRVEVRVPYEPPPGKDGVCFSAVVVIKHDVFFGDPLEQHLAGKYELGTCAVFKGQRYELGGLSEAQRKRLTPDTVDVCYDLVATGAVVSTRCPRTLLSADMPGSSNWKDFIPGLSASEAKALFKSGYELTNVRITGFGGSELSVLSGLTPSGPAPTDSAAFRQRGEGGVKANPFVEPPPPPPPGPPPASNFGLPDGGSAYRCQTPNFSRNGPAVNCARFTAFSQQPSLMTDGTTVRQLGLAVTSLTLEHKPYAYPVYTAQTEPPLAPQMTLSGLASCSRYEVRLRATCEDGSQGPYTDVMLLQTACPVPQDLAVTSVTQTSADVRYLVPTEPMCTRHETWSYDVEWKSKTTGWSSRIHTGGPLTLGGLQPGTTYFVRMRTRFPNGGPSDWSDIASFKTRN